MKDLALLLIRVMTGGTLISHGYPKLFGGEGRTAPALLTTLYGPNFSTAVEGGGPEKFAEALASMDVPYPKASAYAAALAEFGGGLALLVGIQTRLAALAVIFNMAVAIRKAHWQAGFFGQGGYAYPAQLMAMAGALFLGGPGAISVDGVVGGARKAGRAARNAGRAVSSALPASGD